MSDDLTAPLEPHDREPTLPCVDYAEQVSVTGIHDPVLREKTEPREGLEPLPLWLITILFAAFAWGGWYLGSYSGAYRGDIFEERMGPAVAAGGMGAAGGRAGAATPLDEAAAFLKLGRRQFTVNCQTCHQSTGLGQPGVYPPLAGSEYVLGGKKRVIAIVLKGLQGPLRVKGATFNNVMQSWEPVLDDKKIAAVLSFVRQEWGNQAPPITPAEVAAVRAEFASRKNAWTEAEVIAIPENAPINVPGAQPIAPAAVQQQQPPAAQPANPPPNQP
jgi:mono/diheme cytochrome c family protein